MRIAIIGANGQLGCDLVRVFSDDHHDVLALTHAEIEISNLESVRRSIGTASPDLVINTAAMHHVENCEKDPAAAYAVNALGARNLAQVTRELGAALLHVSTDYVFDGAKNTPYTEDDLPLPLNVYGNSKLAGEYYVRTLNPRHFVVRTSGLYGQHRCRAKGGQNFVDRMLELARTRGQVRVVADEFVSPTSTLELSRQILKLSTCEAYDLYHATSEGSCSWYEFAREIFSLTEIPVKLEAAAPGEFPAKTPRPAYSVLENARLKRLGINLFSSWQEGLRQYLVTSRQASVAEVAS